MFALLRSVGLGLLVFSYCVTWAATSSTPATNSQIKISVKGMVCGFCTRGISEKFSKETGVEKVDVSLEDGVVTLFLKDDSLSDKRIGEVVADAGFTAGPLKRIPSTK